MFVLASNHFRRCFTVNVGVWLRMKNSFSRKYFQLTVKIMALTWKIFYTSILPSNHFRTSDTQREREREKESELEERVQVAA